MKKQDNNVLKEIVREALRKTHKEILLEQAKFNKAMREGLNNWINDFIKTTNAGNIKMAQRIYANIVKIAEERGFDIHDWAKLLQIINNKE